MGFPWSDHEISNWADDLKNERRKSGLPDLVKQEHQFPNDVHWWMLFSSFIITLLLGLLVLFS